MQQYTHGRPLAIVGVATLEDSALLSQWENHIQPLEQAGLISFWSERHLVPGANRVQAFQHQFGAADIILLLLSADFFASPDCLMMMELAVQRSKEGAARVIPLLLRPVAWQESPLGTLAPWPSNGKPILLWNHQDEGWDACVRELRRLLGRQVSLALPSERPPKLADPDWERMLRRLRRSYQELFDQSLHGIAWVELGLATQLEMVSNVTNLLFRLPQGGERLLAPGTSMLDAFDEAEGELLILGAPGAGKSTLLLDLAQQLVSRALADPTHPLPVILRLSSWALGKPALADWMVEQLSLTYDVPRRLSERWVTQGRLLPLLDGLDEMEEATRPACIAAINTYHRTHLAPLVVCSRQAEYEGATRHERLVLQSAVIVQPLNKVQIESYLSGTGPSFAGVRTALHQEQELRELATTPLMLSVLLLTYRGATASEIIQQGTDLERQVWTDYVARQVAEKGQDPHYSLEQTRHWLTYLAQQMRFHQQTIFSAEYLQPDWLARDQQRTVMWQATRLPSILLGGCVGLLAPLLIGGDTRLVFQMGLLGGFVGKSLSQQIAVGPVRVSGHLFAEKQAHFRNALLLSMLVAVNYTLSLSPRGRVLQESCILSLGSGLSFWLFQGLISRMLRQPGGKARICPSGLWNLTTWFTRRAAPSFWQATLVLGAGTGLSIGLSIGLSAGLSAGLSDGLGSGLLYGLIYGLGSGLQVSVMVVLIHVILTGAIGSLRFAERIQWTWHDLLRRQHLRTSLIVAGTLFLSYALISGLSAGLIYGLSAGLIVGLSSGLSSGLSFGLSYWMLLGLYQGMKQGHLEDQDRQQFNQGIRRSLRNGLLISLLSALIISAMSGLTIELISGLSVGLSSGLSYGLREGLSSGLNEWLGYGLREGLIYGLLLLFPGLLIMWALSGGLTILRHYVIRWHLAHHRTFPWRAQAFLDDATTRILLRRVGGGYSFIHRRMQDYFADTVIPPPQK